MKKYSIIISLMLGVLFVVPSCTKDFDEINTSKTQVQASNLNPQLLLQSLAWNVAIFPTGYTNHILMSSMWMQALTSAQGHFELGDKYTDPAGQAPLRVFDLWNNGYLALVKADEIERLTKEKPELNNLRQATIILKVIGFSILTDAFGDIPYSEALSAKENIFRPKYDPQNTIYLDLLSKLDLALKAFDNTAITNDIIYGGKIDAWKKLGYSVMLRLALRLDKKNKTKAQEYVNKAVAGGVLTSATEDAVIQGDFSNGYQGGSAGVLNQPSDFENIRWAETFIDLLKTKNDNVRLTLIAEIPPQGYTANAKNSEGKGNQIFADQIGMPNGYTATTISTAPGYPGTSKANPTTKDDKDFDMGNYSRPVDAYRNRGGPIFIMGYWEVEFLLADAILRGYTGITGTTKEHYLKGIKASMQSLNAFGLKADDATIDAYLAGGQFIADPTLKQVNEQFYLAGCSLMHFFEVWTNWRRTGFPNLTPISYPNQLVNTIPTRIPYPVTEAQTNPNNYKTINWNNRVWWNE